MSSFVVRVLALSVIATMGVIGPGTGSIAAGTSRVTKRADRDGPQRVQKRVKQRPSLKRLRAGTSPVSKSRIRSGKAKAQSRPHPETWTPVSHQYTNAKGKAKVQLFANPHFRQTASGWVPLSASIKRRGGSFPLKVSGSAVPMSFGQGVSPLLRWDLPRGGVSMDLRGAKQTRPQVISNETKASRVRFNSIMPGVRLDYVNTGHGVKELLTLESAKSPRLFTFDIADPRHLLGKATPATDESYQFSGAVGDGLRMSLDAPQAWSTKRRPANTESAAQGTFQPSAHQSVKRTAGGYTVTLRLDDEWVKDKAFPIVLDPSVTYSYQDHTMTAAYGYTSPGCEEETEDEEWCKLASGFFEWPGGPWSPRPAGELLTEKYDNGRPALATYVGLNLSNYFTPAEVESAELEIGLNEPYVYQDTCGTAPAPDIGATPVAAGLKPGDSWWDVPELHPASPTASELDFPPASPARSLFTQATGTTSSGADRYTADVTSAVNDWIGNPHSARAGFVLVMTEPAGDPPTGRTNPGCDASAGEGWGFHAYVYDPSLTLTADEVLPTPIPVEQTWGCACTQTAQVADPVNTANGNATETITDLQAVAPGIPLEFSRTYNGMDSADGPLGPGWTHAYETSLVVDSGTGDVTVKNPSGGREKFIAQTGGTYLPDPGVVGTLEAVSGGGWMRRDSNGEEWIYNSAGRLTSEKDAQGHGLTFGYTGSGAGARLTAIEDAAGHQTDLVYGTSGAADGKLTGITTEDGRDVHYAYDTVASADRLTSITAVDGSVTDIHYDSSSGKLDKITDDNDAENARNTYDATTGRITSQLDADGNTWQFDWQGDDTPGAPDGTGIATVTDPLDNESKDYYYGNVRTRHTDEAGGDTYFWYDDQLNLIAVKDPRGLVTQMSYDSHGNLLTRTPPAEFSFVETWTYDSADRVTSYTNGEDETTGYEYNSAGQVETTTDALDHETHYSYNGQGLVESIEAPGNKTTSYEYDTAGNLTVEELPSGAETTYDYDAAGNITSEVSPRGNVTGADPEDYATTYTYDDAGRVLTTTDPHGTVTENTYDSLGNLTGVTVVDEEDHTLSATTYAYDVLNRPLTTTHGGEVTLTQTYDALGHLLTSADGTGATTTYTYDERGQLATKMNPNGIAWDYPEGSTFSYDYDADGNLTRVTDPDGVSHVTVYDPLNRPIQTFNQTGEGSGTYRTALVTTAYDDASRPTASTDALGHTEHYGYDDNGRLTSNAKPGQDPALFAYDASGNRTSATSPSGASTTTWTYDDDGHVATQIDPAGNVSGATPSQHATKYEYDPDGNVTNITDQLGHETSYDYDELGNRVGQTNPRGKMTTWAYDKLGRTVSITSPGPAGGETRFEYDTHDNVVSREDANNHTTTYEYNERHQVTAFTDPLDRKWRFTYDADGNQESKTLPQGDPVDEDDPWRWTMWTGYDANGRLVSQSGQASDAQAAHLFQYYTYNQDGRVIGADADTWLEGAEPEDNWTRTTATHSVLAYDAAGRLTEQTNDNRIGESGETELDVAQSYTYTAAGAVASRTVEGEGSVDYAHDADGLITSMEVNGKTSTFDYNANQALTDITYPASVGLIQARTYDRTGHLSTVDTRPSGAANPTSRYEYTRDSNGNPTHIMRTRGTSQHDEAYTYDSLDQLGSYCPGSDTCVGATDHIDYAYDAVGNRTEEDRTGVSSPGTTTYSYDGADQLTSQTKGTAATSYTYDDAGRLTTGGRTYDADGHLLSVGTSATNTFTYDAFGNRASTTGLAGTRVLTWDLNNQLPMLAAITGDDETATTHSYNPTGAILQSDHDDASYDRTFYAAADLASVTDTFEGDGTPVSQFAYEPFGQADQDDLITSPVNNGFGFTGAWSDGESAQTYLRARDYDPGLGRFTTLDPLASTGGVPKISDYGYVGNRPSYLVDPTGMTSCDPRQNPFCGLSEKIQEATEAVMEPLVHVIAGAGRTYVLIGTTFMPSNGIPLLGPQLTASMTGAQTPLQQYDAAIAHLGIGPPNRWDTAGEVAAPLPLPGVGAAAGAACKWGLRFTDRLLAKVMGRGAAKSAGAFDDHIVLGLEEHGLRETASKVGGRHLMGDSFFRETFVEAAKNPRVRFTVSLDGFKGSGVKEQISRAIEDGLANGSDRSWTNWELAVLYRNGRLGDVTFVRGGSSVPNPYG